MTCRIATETPPQMLPIRIPRVIQPSEKRCKRIKNKKKIPFFGFFFGFFLLSKCTSRNAKLFGSVNDPFSRQNISRNFQTHPSIKYESKGLIRTTYCGDYLTQYKLCSQPLFSAHGSQTCLLHLLQRRMCLAGLPFPTQRFFSQKSHLFVPVLTSIKSASV